MPVFTPMGGHVMSLTKDHDKILSPTNTAVVLTGLGSLAYFRRKAIPYAIAFALFRAAQNR